MKIAFVLTILFFGIILYIKINHLKTITEIREKIKIMPVCIIILVDIVISITLFKNVRPYALLTYYGLMIIWILSEIYAIMIQKK